MANTFARIAIENWRQFELVDIPLDRQVTVLTGPNGCGKTTLLNTLGRHFGWNVNLVSTPFLSERQQAKIWSEFGRERIDDDRAASLRTIGSITYSNGRACTLHVPEEASKNPQYTLQYHGQQTVHGLTIPSHQPAVNYQAVGQIPTDPKAAESHYQDFQQLLLQSYVSERARNPTLALKQSLIALAVFGPGNAAVAPNLEYRSVFENFQETLRRTLPRDLGFQRLEIRMPDVVLVTSTGDFALDAMSGGVGALFMVAWQIQLFTSTRKGPCTVLLDEPENHLHPSMQRSLLPSLSAAFPENRFIVATHSPFVVASDPGATVVALTFGATRKISSQILDEADLASSPSIILREVLDVPTTVPMWVEEKIRSILQKHHAEQNPAIRAERIFDELKAAGLNRALAEVNLGAPE